MGAMVLTLNGSPGLEHAPGLTWTKAISIIRAAQLRALNQTLNQTLSIRQRHPRTVTSKVPPRIQTQYAKPNPTSEDSWSGPRETSRDRPLKRGSCGRITPVTAENDLAAFLPFPWTRDQKEAKLCDGPRLPPSLNLDEPLDV